MGRYSEPAKNDVSQARLRVADPLMTMEEVTDSADATLASLQKMMELSDVGTFKYSPEGNLRRLNKSWYRMSLHPSKAEAHKDFSLTNLVYPPDIPLVLSQWNKLSQSIPVAFEMRWKGID